MKKLVLIIAALLTGTGSSLAASDMDKNAAIRAYRYGNSFIFVENGITFSVYPDGEFDFYLDNQVDVNAHVGAGPVGITFNSGYNYNPFVQYDDYGAVIQVENVPVFYDYYGRVSRIGGVNIWYRNGLAYRIGGMNIFYNRRGFYDYHTGFINVYNRVYVYRPWHRFFARPALGFCMVFNRPYRRYYNPVRYTYYRPYRQNYRRAYASVGKTYRHAPRAERTRVYRNDSRVAVRSNDRAIRGEVRSNRAGKPGQAARTARIERNRTVATQGRQPAQRTVNRSSRTVVKSPQGRTTRTSRTVTTRTPETRRAPAARKEATKTVTRSAPARRTVQARQQAQKRTVKRSDPVRRTSQARNSRPVRNIRKEAVKSGRRSGTASRNTSRGRNNGRGMQ